MWAVANEREERAHDKNGILCGSKNSVHVTAFYAPFQFSLSLSLSLAGRTHTPSHDRQTSHTSFISKAKWVIFIIFVFLCEKNAAGMCVQSVYHIYSPLAKPFSMPYLIGFYDIYNGTREDCTLCICDFCPSSNGQIKICAKYRFSCSYRTLASPNILPLLKLLIVSTIKQAKMNGMSTTDSIVSRKWSARLSIC